VWLTQLLAEFNNAPNSRKIGEKEVLRDGFGDSRPYFHVLIAELTSDNTSAVIPTVDPERPSSTLPHNDRIVGHALYFYTYTREGKCLFLEDLFVRNEYRSYGIGTALLQELAKVACEEECARLQLEVLDRNTRAAKLYERIGCKIMREWLPVRMSQPELGTFAAGKGFPDNARNKL
jgi:GNAT superfamily N-acetyltransferase